MTKKYVSFALKFLSPFLPLSTKVAIQRIGISYWTRLFVVQRLLRINSHVPWPCHWSSIVSGVNNIHLKTFPPYPGLGIGQYIQGMNGIYFGENVRLGPGVIIISANHNLLDFERHDFCSPIVIGDYCWLGARSVILPGVKLAKHVIVAAGSVVTKSFKEEDIVIGGVPAKLEKKIDPYKGGKPKHIYFRYQVEKDGD